MAKRNRPDHYTNLAKKAGYAARSVYKLEEIDRKAGLLARGMRVLDIGAAPGSWTQYALERVGSGGRVVSVDLRPLALRPGANLTTIEGDVTDEAVRERLRNAAPYDVLLSDAAPSTTGNRTVDSARSAALVELVLSLAGELLTAGGSLVAKLFQGGDEQELLRAAKARFARAKLQRPAASRSDSFEVFIVGVDHQYPPSRHTAGSDHEGGPR
jgi:23S rRNA (uridine2552-2'-O)-methyltransferase